MRAILSVSDKSGIDRLGSALAGLGAEIYSTGGTLQALRAAGVPAQPISALTGFPEILGGRVKTLHPAVYGGILARRQCADNARRGDLKELSAHGLEPIDLVAVNLYPFEATVAASDVSLPDALEQIDIGGPALLRAAAKNHTSVVPLCDPADYEPVVAGLAQPDGLDADWRRRLAAKAFSHTAAYDAVIAAYLGGEGWPSETAIGLRKVADLRYGENPAQQAAFYQVAAPSRPASSLLAGEQLQGKALSYSNILDAGAAWDIVGDYARAGDAASDRATVAIVKHTNPCGLSQARDSLDAYQGALSGDPIAAFGGIVACSVPIGVELARVLVERFYEIVLAPGFSPGALEALAARPNLRVLALPIDRTEPATPVWRSAGGGLLVQEPDCLPDTEVGEGQAVTGRSPTGDERQALQFAWRAVRHVKSNAIVLAQGETLVGMGAGQPSRVASVEIAVRRAGARAAGAVLASDAFFPKPDGVELAAKAGVRAIVQPGGSLGDEEVIAAADAAGMAMVFTGARHFLH
jgi:phosphoribosylaminoimidazolecarboxamide formyltransferase/IMP cyclohydrolase